MPQVVKSRSKDLLQVDDFGTDLTNQTLNRIMEQAVESSPKMSQRGVRKARLLGSAMPCAIRMSRTACPFQIQREIESSLQVGSLGVNKMAFCQGQMSFFYC